MIPESELITRSAFAVLDVEGLNPTHLCCPKAMRSLVVSPSLLIYDLEEKWKTYQLTYWPFGTVTLIDTEYALRCVPENLTDDKMTLVYMVYAMT